MRNSGYIAPLLLLSMPLSGQEINSSYEEGVYRVEMDVWIDAQPDQVWALLTDYQHLTRLDDRITESHRLERLQTGEWIVFTRARGCVFIFCKTVERVESVVETRPDHISATVLPDKSSFEYGVTDMFLAEIDGGTQLRYVSEIKPDFGLPPLIGKRSLRKTMEKTARRLAASLEELADEIHVHPEDEAHP